MSLEAAAKRLVEAYDDLKFVEGSYGYVAAFIALDKTGKVLKEHLRGVCHGYLKHTPPGADILLSSMPNENDAFYEFLKNVLYKRWSDHIHYETEPTTGRSYIMLDGLDTMPANVVQNFLVCSRSPFEIVAKLEVWEQLCLEGMHPSVAYLFCKTKDIKAKVNDPVLKIFYHQHWPFDLQVDLARIVSGDPHNLSVPFKQNPADCVPTNLIWSGVGDKLDLKKLNGVTIRDFYANWKAEHEDILLVSG